MNETNGDDKASWSYKAAAWKMTILGANGRSQEAFLRKQPLKRVKVTTNNNIYPRCKDPKPSDMSVPPPPRPLGRKL